MDKEMFEDRLDAWRKLYDTAKKQLDNAVVEVEIHKRSIARMHGEIKRCKVERNVVLALWFMTVGLLLVLI